MTFLELRHAIVSLINQEPELSIEEVYGVLMSIEVEVRVAMVNRVSNAMRKETK